MSLIFRLVLFLHLIGVLGFVGLMWSFGIGLTRIQQFDNVEVVRSWVTMARTCNRQASWFLLLLLVTGIFLTIQIQASHQAYIQMAVIFLILMGALNGGGLGSWIKKGFRSLNSTTTGSLSTDQVALLRSKKIWVFYNSLRALTLGAVLLMIDHPGFRGSILLLIVSLVGGGLWTLGITFHKRS
jgi:hypothetical protein